MATATIDFDDHEYLTKEEVGEFIEEELGLTEDGEPEWSTGILGIVHVALEESQKEIAWEHEIKVAYEKLRELYEAFDELKRENKRLRWHLNDEEMPRFYEERLEDLKKENEILRGCLSDDGIPRIYKERLEDLKVENEELRQQLSDA